MSVPAFTLVQGLVVGLGYGLLAMGLVLIYRTSRVLNFAHGQLGVVSAILLSKLVIDDHVPYAVAIIAALVIAAVVGAASELVLRRLFGRPRVIVMVATIGLAQVLYLITVVPLVRPSKLYASYPVPFHLHFSVGTQLFGAGDVLTLIAAPLVALALAVFFARSRAGLNIRAIAENGESARLSGIWVRRTSMFAWVLASVLSAITAILASPAKANSFTQSLGPELLLRALAAALLGAMTSLPIAFVAGIGIGIFEQVVSWNYPTTSNLETVMFVLLLAVLVVGVRRLRRGPRDEERSSWRLTASTRPAASDPRVGRATTAIVVALALLVPLLADNSRNFLISRIYVYAIVALSLTVLTGWAGQVSLGNFGLVAVGAVLTARMLPGQSILLVLVVAAAVSAVVAVVIGLPALRIRGLYLAVTTLGFALFMNVSVLPTSCWRTPGFGWHVCTGLPSPASTLITRPSIFGISLRSQRAMDYFVLAILVVAVVVVRSWRDHGVARGLIAVRDNEIGAAAMGSRVMLHKLTAFALSGALAGVAGVCFALVTERFSAVTFAPSLSLIVVAMVVIGGLGSIEGALLGAAYLIGIPAAFGSGPTVQFITSGVGLLLFLLYVPDGLAGIAQRIGERIAAALPSRPATARADSRPGEPKEQTSGASLAIDRVAVAFGGLHAVDGVSFTAAAGEVVGIIGPNGSGKTTLLDSISGLVPLAAGTIALDGEDLVDYLPADRAWLGLTRSFQDCRLFPELTVEQTLLVGEDARQPVGVAATTAQLPAARRLEAEKRATIEELLETLHLGPFRDKLISELSTGTRRIVDLATVLAARPRVLLLDEPTAGLAQREAEAFGPLLEEIHELTGATVLIVEHDVPLTLALCDRVVVMEAGRLVSVGTPAEVTADPAAIAAYLGASAAAIGRTDRRVAVGR
ncbi:MAG: ABC transporter permease subunit [Acidimicrobiales bacterium]